MKTLIVFGTRPEAIKMFPVVRALAATPGVTVRTCITAQHREMLDQVLAIAGLAPDIDLDLMQPGQVFDTRGIWPDQPAHAAIIESATTSRPLLRAAG